MPPLSFVSFSSLSRFRRGETFSFVRSGMLASVGMFQVFPVKNAPWILPAAHQLRTVLSDSPCASAYCLTDKYSIFIRGYRQVFCRGSLANILILADNGKWCAK